MENEDKSIEGYFEELYNESLDALNLYFEVIKKKPLHMQHLTHSLENEYERLGIIELCYRKNLKESRKYYYRATLAREWFYKQIEKKEYDVELYWVSAIYFERLYDAILSGSKERAIYMANLYGSIEVDVEVHPANILLGYALMYTILDDKEQALKYVQKLEESRTKRGMKQYADGNARVFRGLIERDEMEFNKGLEFMLKHHVARMKREGRYLEQFFAYDCVAAAMIAKDRGISINVKHELLPMKYLEDTEIDYSELELF